MSSKINNTRYDYKFSFVMPVYNVERYLDEAVQSVLDQTMDFKKNCEIIFVNDGSTDKSEAICLKYKERFPDNIQYIKQKNSGAEAARNTGIHQVRGKYISFLDSDDRISPNALDEVYNFFESHYDEVDFVSIKMEYFEAKTGEHGLNYKYSGDRVVRIAEEYKSIQTTIGSSFVKGEVFQEGWKFRPEVLNVADAEFLFRLVLEKMAYGVVAAPTYYYRKRHTDDSLTKLEKQTKDYFLTQPKYGYLSILEYCKSKLGHVNEYTQWLVLYYLRVHAKMKHEDILSAAEYKKYQLLIRDILQYINDDLLLKRDNRIKYHSRLYLASLKHGKDVVREVVIKDDGIAYWNNIAVYAAKRVRIALMPVAVSGGSLLVEGFHGGYLTDGFKVVANINGSDIDLHYTDKIFFETYCMGKRIYNDHSFRQEIPMKSVGKSAVIKFYTICAGKKRLVKKLKYIDMFDVETPGNSRGYEISGYIVGRIDNGIAITKNSLLHHIKKRLRDS